MSHVFECILTVALGGIWTSLLLILFEVKKTNRYQK